MRDSNQPHPETCPFRPDEIIETQFAVTADFAAIYNIAPIVPGHSLIIPRRHVQSIFELTDDECFAFFAFARRVTRLLVEAFSGDSFDWTLQEGEAAGQSVPHLHLHVIPRWKGDLVDPGDWYPMLEAQRRKTRDTTQYIDSANRTQLSNDERRQVVEHLRSFVDSRGV